MKEFLLLRVIVKFIFPFILLFGLFVQFNGENAPGGGFQSGLIIASTLILYGLVFGLRRAKKLYPQWVVVRMAAFGLLLYAGTGVATLLMGGNMLEYSVLKDSPIAGQHLGLLLIESGVCITVAHVMILIYYSFSSHRLTLESRKERK